MIEFRGHRITLSPETDQLFPTMMVKLGKGFGQDTALRLLSEFATSVAWAEGLGVNLTEISVCSSPRLMLGRGPVRRGHVGSALFDYLPAPTDRKTKLALAIFREALTVNLVPYQFLAFYRIVNLHAGREGGKQKAWINAELPSITDTKAIKRMTELAAEGVSNIGQYLYRQGRCAAAHASLTEPTINPDDPSDFVRLDRDLPIMRALATRIVEHHLGIKTVQTLRRERISKRNDARKH